MNKILFLLILLSFEAMARPTTLTTKTTTKGKISTQNDKAKVKRSLAIKEKVEDPNLIVYLPKSYIDASKAQNPTKEQQKLKARSKCIDKINEEIMLLKQSDTDKYSMLQNILGFMKVDFVIDPENSTNKINLKEEKVVISLKDLKSKWCEEDAQEDLKDEIWQKLYDLLTEKLPENLFEIFDKIAILASNGLKSPSEICKIQKEIYDLENESFFNYKFNEITGEIFYPDGQLVVNKTLKALLYDYFYNRRHGNIAFPINETFEKLFTLNAKTKEITKRIGRGKLTPQQLKIAKEYFQKKESFSQTSHIVEGGILLRNLYFKGKGIKRFLCTKEFQERSREGKLVFLNGDSKEKCFSAPVKSSHNHLSKIFKSLFLNVQKDHESSKEQEDILNKVFEKVKICDADGNCKEHTELSYEDVLRKIYKKNMQTICEVIEQGEFNCIEYRQDQKVVYDKDGKKMVINENQYIDKDGKVQTLKEGQKVDYDNEGNNIALDENQYIDNDGNLQTLEDGKRLTYDDQGRKVVVNDDEEVINGEIVKLPHGESELKDIGKRWLDNGVDQMAIKNRDEEKIRGYINDGSITIEELENFQEQHEAHGDYCIKVYGDNCINDELESELRKMRELIEKLKQE